MRRGFLSSVVLLPVVALACSSSSSDGTSNGGSNGTGGDQGTFVFGTGVDGGGIIATSGGAACVSDSVATEAAPLDIYVMFDQSCSMSCPSEQVGPGLCCTGGPRPRIDQVRSAMNQFLENPKSAGIGVGIGYFGYLPVGRTSCDPGQYSKPAVPIDVLPANTQAIEASLQAATPTGETPTGAAIRGACSYATTWKQQNPGRVLVVLLVTDGVPEAPVSFTCKPTLADAETAARDCAAQAQVPTYVLGVGGNLDNLNGLAQAGGTDHAYLAGGTTDVSGAVLDALNQIRDGASVPCKFKVPAPPSGQQLDPNRVNVTYDDASGKTHLVPGAGTASACGTQGGWYYDDPAAPATLQLCPTTCNTVTAQLVAASVLGRGAKLDLQYGCDTVTITR